MAKIWITYAWVDNENQDIDFVAQELTNVGLTVKLDRWNLSAGHRLWEQIEKFIVRPDESDAWLLIATQNSLSSEACKEEFSYALQRALRERGANYPVIALFLGPVEDSLIPAGIKSRLFVSITDPDWKERIAAAAERRDPRIVAANVQPYYLKIHKPKIEGELLAIEVRPRAGYWAPFFAAIPIKERDEVGLNMITGPAGTLTRNGALWNTGETTSKDGNWWVIFADNQANPTTSYYLWCKVLPSKMCFGTKDKQPNYWVDFGGTME